VFDAGSTHTALYVYQWSADKENGTGIVSQVESCTVNGESRVLGRVCPSPHPLLRLGTPGLEAVLGRVT